MADNEHAALVDRVALAINKGWNTLGDVPFPLYQFEAEKLAEIAIAAVRGEDAELGASK